MRVDSFQALKKEESSLQLASEDFKDAEKPNGRGKKYSSRIFIKLVAVLCLMLMVYSFYQVHTRDCTEQALASETVEHEVRGDTAEAKAEITKVDARTPKILWVLTHRNLEGMRMTDALVARHLMHVGKKSGFEVRVVNSLTAYDWLSPEMTEMVRKTKHTSKYIISVH